MALVEQAFASKRSKINQDEGHVVTCLCLPAVHVSACLPYMFLPACLPYMFLPACRHTGYDDCIVENHSTKPMERLLRRLLALPGKPAVIMMQVRQGL